MSKQYNKKMIVIFTLLLMGLFIIGTATIALGVPASGGIDITVKTDLGAAKPGLSVEILKSGISLVQGVDYALTTPISGKYTVKGLVYGGDYSVTLTEGTLHETILVKGVTTNITGALKAAGLVWSTSDGADALKAGAIAGIVLNSVYAPSVGADVKVFNATTTWTSVTDANGAFRFYLPSGSYQLIVYGKDSTYKNNIYNLTVVAGQVATPLKALNNQDAIAQLGLVLDAPAIATPDDTGTGTLSGVDGATIAITGTVNKNAKVSIYDITSVPNKLLVAVVPDKVLGKFAAKFAAQPGKKLRLQVTDPAENTYTLDMAGASHGLGLQSTVNAEFGKDVIIAFTGDGTGKMTSVLTTVYVDDEVVVVGPAPAKYILTPGTATTAGKLLIKAGALDLGSHTIKLVNTNFADATSTVTIGTSATVLAAKLTVTAAAYGSAGDSKLTVIPGVGNSIKYLISNTAITIPKLGTDSATIVGIATLADTKIVSGLDAVNNKYLGVYEVTADGTVVKFAQLTIISTSVNTGGLAAPAAPVVTISPDRKSIFLTFLNDIYRATTTDLLLKAAFKVGKTTPAALALNDTVSISGNVVTVSVYTAVYDGVGNIISINAGALQNLYGLKNAAITSNIDLSAVPNSTVLATKTYNKFGGTTLDIAMTLMGNTLTSIADGVGTLSSPADYSVSGSTVTLTQAYLQGEAVGDVTLTFAFSAGATDTTVITVSDTTPPAPALGTLPTFADALGLANNGKTTITLGASSNGTNTFKYTVSGDVYAVPTPLLGADVSSWTTIASGGTITAANGKHIGIAEVDGSGKVVKFSDALAVTVAYIGTSGSLTASAVSPAIGSTNTLLGVCNVTPKYLKFTVDNVLKTVTFNGKYSGTGSTPLTDTTLIALFNTGLGGSATASFVNAATDRRIKIVSATTGATSTVVYTATGSTAALATGVNSFYVAAGVTATGTGAN